MTIVGPNICSGHEDGDRAPHEESVKWSCLLARDSVSDLPFPFPCPEIPSFCNTLGSQNPVSGTCVLVFRIQKDFGSHVLPLRHGGFFDASRGPPQTVASLEDLLISARFMLPEVEDTDRPAWQFGANVGGGFVAVLYLPRTSVMARRWASDMQSQLSPIGGILGPVNGTLPDAVAADTTLVGVDTS